MLLCCCLRDGPRWCEVARLRFCQKPSNLSEKQSSCLMKQQSELNRTKSSQMREKSPLTRPMRPTRVASRHPGSWDSAALASAALWRRRRSRTAELVCHPRCIQQTPRRDISRDGTCCTAASSFGSHKHAARLLPGLVCACSARSLVDEAKARRLAGFPPRQKASLQPRFSSSAEKAFGGASCHCPYPRKLGQARSTEASAKRH